MAALGNSKGVINTYGIVEYIDSRVPTSNNAATKLHIYNAATKLHIYSQTALYVKFFLQRYNDRANNFKTGAAGGCVDRTYSFSQRSAVSILSILRVPSTTNGNRSQSERRTRYVRRPEQISSRPFFCRWMKLKET